MIREVKFESQDRRIKGIIEALKRQRHQRHRGS